MVFNYTQRYYFLDSKNVVLYNVFKESIATFDFCIFLMVLVVVSIAPVLVIAFYIYFRDKYEKEPVGLLLKSLFLGAFLMIPVLFLERFFYLFTPGGKEIFRDFYDAFVVTAFTEEALKIAAIFALVWRDRNFNEKFDGIVYAVFIGIGFAGVENMMYVHKGGLSVGIVRAITAVPFHALLGVIMGYYLGNAKFDMENQKQNIIKAFLLPFFFHGLYDFCLMANKPILLLLWIPFLLFLYKDGFKKMFRHVEDSVFKP